VISSIFFAIIIDKYFNRKGIKWMEDKALLSVKEFCEYLGIGESKGRELLHTTRNGFTVRIGNRLYANKKQLDKWLDMQCL
jgi:excisionase family DNA binding protein